ncbi:MAG: prepilin-type N-terminal cleavage/methylation domain-containing protein [Acidobacteria bacterium]|nr:prepilin-type N-terminal cleavage/methylation domain-containing protein [Acidobacteriota bacterium]
MKKKPSIAIRLGRREAGMTLIETVIALGILLVVSTGIMTIALVAITTTETQGHLAARTAEYAQDKMEQLSSLSYADSVSDTTQFPSVNFGGTGLLPGGSSDPDSPEDGYTDYLDASGTPMAVGEDGAAPDGWYFKRVWEISYPAGTLTMKQLTVTAIVAFNATSTGSGKTVQATVTGLKTSPF